MATMFPPSYPGEPNPDNPEFNVYQAMKTLPDHYTVFYSKKFKGTGSWKEEGEIDFVIFDGSKSLLCMEVKGGKIAFDGVDDVWLQNDKVLSPQPDRQATEGMRALMKFFSHDIQDLNCGWVLGFPHCSLPENFQSPTRIPKSVIIDQANFLDIEGAIKKAEHYYIDHYKRVGIDAAAAMRIRQGLTRSVEFIQKTGVRVARDSQQLMQITEEQFRVLEDLEVNPRIAIRGYAGTGKTALATEFARRLGATGQKTLLLFFNKMIAGHTRRSFDRDLPITCTTFHSFAKRTIEAQEPEWWASCSNKSEPEFWEVELPLKLLEIPPSDESRFDAIIVDEGQDFRPEWYEYLETLMKNPSNGRFAVFFDEDQDLFGRWNELPWGGEGITRKLLRENCRNTRSIVSFLNDKHPTDMSPCSFSPQGEAVIERTAGTPSEARVFFEKDVGDLFKQGVRPGQIIALLDKPKRESCLAEVTKIGKVRFESLDRYYDEKTGSVGFTTINMFKGMEADIVFLIYHGAENALEDGKQLYVSGSRARTVLYIYQVQPTE